MDAIECIMTRKSVKSFSDKMPSKTDLQTILDAARHAPSGMNKQTWRFSVVSNKLWLKAVTKKLGEYLGRGSDYCCYYNAPVLVIVSASPEHNTSEADCACAIENMYLAANALGLGACWINQLGKANCSVIREELTTVGVPTDNLVYGCIALGYPADGYFRPVRVPLDGTVTYFD